MEALGVPSLWAMLLTGSVEASSPLLMCRACHAVENAGSVPPAAALHTCHRPGPGSALPAALRSLMGRLQFMRREVLALQCGAGSIAEQDQRPGHSPGGGQGPGGTREQRQCRGDPGTGRVGRVGRVTASASRARRGPWPCSGRETRRQLSPSEVLACCTGPVAPAPLHAGCVFIFVNSAPSRSWTGGP